MRIGFAGCMVAMASAMGGAALGIAAPARAQSTPAPAATSASAEVNGVGSNFELVFWQSVGNSDDPAMYEAYLGQYPNGTFAGLARAKIAALNRVATRAIAAPVEAPPAAVSALAEQAPPVQAAPAAVIAPVAVAVQRPPASATPLFKPSIPAPEVPAVVAPPPAAVATVAAEVPAVGAPAAISTPVASASAPALAIAGSVGPQPKAPAPSASAPPLRPPVAAVSALSAPVLTVPAKAAAPAEVVMPASAPPIVPDAAAAGRVAQNSDLLAALASSQLTGKEALPAALRIALPPRPTLADVPGLNMPEAFCSLDERKVYHDSVYKPAMDVASHNNEETIKYLRSLDEAYKSYREVKDIDAMNTISAEAQAYHEISDWAFNTSSAYTHLFDALMAIPIRDCGVK